MIHECGLTRKSEWGGTFADVSAHEAPVRLSKMKESYYIAPMVAIGRGGVFLTREVDMYRQKH